MVDALRRAREWVTPNGSVIDVHPTSTPAWLEVDGQRLGPLDGGDAPERHARATAALARVVDEGLFSVRASADFVFYTSGDSIDELSHFIEAHWRSTRIGASLAAAASARLRAGPSGLRLRVGEHVRLTHLRVGKST